MIVKVCGMREARNIAEVALSGPDLMGFIFYEPSKRNACSMPPEALDALPPSIRRVGVFVDAAPEYVLETVRRYGLDLVQLHGAETPEMCARLRAETGVIKAFGIGKREDVQKTADYEGTCDTYVFDTADTSLGGSGYGGTGRKFDHSLLAAYKGSTPFLLSGGIGPEDAAHPAAYAHPLCAGVDINSRFETAPGVKDPEAIKKFIQTIKQP